MPIQSFSCECSQCEKACLNEAIFLSTHTNREAFCSLSCAVLFLQTLMKISRVKGPHKKEKVTAELRKREMEDRCERVAKQVEERKELEKRRQVQAPPPKIG